MKNKEDNFKKHTFQISNQAFKQVHDQTRRQVYMQVWIQISDIASNQV